MFAQARNTLALAKLVYNNKLDTYKVVIAFNVHKVIKKDKVKYNFPVQAKCNFVSGDISAKELQKDLKRVLTTAHASLRTDCIQFVSN